MRGLTAVVVAFAAVQVPTFATPDEDDTKQPYSHLLYVRMVKAPNNSFKDELALHRMAPVADASKSDAIRKICDAPSFSNIIGVLDGKVVLNVRSGPWIELIDLESGEVIRTKSPAEAIVLDHKRNRLIFAGSRSTLVRQFDLQTKRESVVFWGRKDRPATMGGFGHSSIAMSPDGRWLTIATIAEADEQTEWTDKFEINLIDLTQQPLEPKRLPGTYQGVTQMTGAGDRIHGPALLWTDKSTVLIAANTAAPKVPGVVGVRAIGNERSTITSVDAATLKTKHICEVSAASTTFTVAAPIFSRRSDGQILLSTGAGPFRIDVDKHTATADRQLSKRFTLAGDKHKPMLLSGNKRLARKVNRWDISISPDGNQAVWLVPVHENQFGWSSAPKSMFHSDGAKPTKVITGQWDHSAMLWLRESDLQ